MRCQVHDLVLIHVDGKPVVYARIEALEPDVKPGWLRVRLLVLTVPFQCVTWILQPEQVDGTPFTMGGTPMRLERVVVAQPDGFAESHPPTNRQTGEDSKVISLSGRSKRPS